MKLSSVYSPLKIVHHQDRLSDLKNGGHPSPLLVQLILSDFCNQDCSFCAYRMSGYTSNQNFGIINQDGSVNNNPKRMIERDKALEILADCKQLGVKAIEFTGGGEPTVHPNFAEIVTYANELGLDYSLVTNGVLLNERVREALANATWVRLSLDAGLPETYSKVRRVSPSMFGKAVHNIEALISERQRSDQVIGVSFVVTKENWVEILAAATLAKEIGADYFRIGACFTPDNEDYYAGGIYENIQELCSAAMSFADSKFTVFNQFRGRVGDLIQKSPDYVTCGHMHFNTYIGGDLSVYRCCALAYNDRGFLGSIKDQKFSTLWNSDSVKNDFANFDARGCERCPFNEKNRVIEYILSKNPLHVNFA